MEDISLGVVLAQLINFGIIFFLFKKFLGDKIVEGIQKRREVLKSLEDGEKHIKEKISKAEKEAEEIVNKAKSKASEIQTSAENLAKKQSEAKLQEADAKAKSLVDGALRDIEKERLSMVDSLKEKLLDVSLNLNAKIFANNDSNKEFIKKEINGVKL